MNIAVSIAHAGHIPERKPLLNRLYADLASGPYGLIHIESDKAPPHVWSERQWKVVLKPDMNATHGLFLNDDVILCDHFHETLEAVIAARPNDVISLYCSDPKAAHLVGRWYTSRDGLIGNAYVIPTGLLVQFLEWRSRELYAWAKETLSEDQQINLWCMATGRPIWHTRPSLVEHDVSIPSCYGNESNPARTSVVAPWKNMHELDWTPKRVPHLGRFFHGNHWALLKCIRPEFWRKYDCVNKFYEYHNDYIETVRLSMLSPERPKSMEWCDINDLPEDDYQKRLGIERYEWACRWIRPGAIVANAACGSNFGTPMLMRAGAARVVGFDCGEEQQQVSQAKQYGEFVLADIETQTFDGFDTLVCIETLEHLKEPRSFLADLSPTVTRLVLTTPIVPTKHANPHHLHDFTEEQITEWLTELGWKIEARAYQDDPGFCGQYVKNMVGLWHASR